MYHAGSLTPDSYVLTVTALGFRTHAETITIQSHETRNVRVELGVGGEVMGVIVMGSDIAAEPAPSTVVPDLLPEPGEQAATANGNKKSKPEPASK